MGHLPMSRLTIDLLAMDRLAQKTGAQLKPGLRAALEADLRFHTKMAGPIPDIAPEDLPRDVAPFPPRSPNKRKQA